MSVTLQPIVTGDGPPLLIQGPAWGPSSAYLRATLAPLFPDRRVITYDPRNVGSGPRVADERAQAVEHLVADLEGLRRQLGLERFTLAGHSHGGFITMAYAIRHPERLDALLLFNTRVRRGLGRHQVEQVLAEYAADPARRAAVDLFRATDGRPHDADSDVELARQMRKMMPVYFLDLDAMERFAAAVRDAGLPSAAALARVPEHPERWVEDGLPGVDVPALVLTGRYDVATPPADARHIHELLPDSRLVILERSGHHPWAEEPERFASVVREFLDGV